MERFDLVAEVTVVGVDQMRIGSHNKVLVVCVGNICRSPVTAALFKQICPDMEVLSAGLAAEAGSAVDANANRYALADGLDLSNHISTQISEELVNWADLIFVMSDSQRSHLAAKYPVAMGKIFLLGFWLPESYPNKSIPDPYQKSSEVFEIVHKQMKLAVQSWVSKLLPQSSIPTRITDSGSN